jgi:hypothetical protein
MPDRNCLSFWFPPLLAAGLPVPETRIIETDCKLVRLLNGTILPEYGDFLKKLQEATDRIGYPCFLRTGHTAGKHEWSKTCWIESPNVLSQHVANLLEYSALTGLAGLPTNIWVARKLIPTTPAFHAFRGQMPITREFRLFTDAGEVVCCHPYWPPEAFGCCQPVSDWKQRLAKLSELDEDTARDLWVLARRAAMAVDGGNWSVDLLEDVDGKWWITDMAEASCSFHWPGCPHQKG